MSVAKKTKPALWQSKVSAAKSKFGKWSARAAQWATSEYKKAGGGYKGAKSSGNSLRKWTKQKWRTRDGKPAKRSGGTARYLPDKAWKNLSKSEARATDAKKRQGGRKGKGTVSNTRKAMKASKRARS